MNHLDVFVNDANRVQSTNRNIKTLKDLFTDFLNDTHQLESHTLWRCNRMNPAQILRQIVPKPKRLPTSGMSIERYLAIDTASAPPYRIPDVDCSAIFIIQLKGTRTILLRPTAECKQKCRTISVRLPQSYVCELVFIILILILLDRVISLASECNRILTQEIHEMNLKFLYGFSGLR